MAVGIGRDPGKYIRLPSLGGVLRYFDGRRPARPQIVRERVINVGVIRPDGVHVAEVVDRERREQITEAEAGGTRRTRPTTEDLVVGER